VGESRGIFNLSRERSEIFSKSCPSKNVQLENLDLDGMRPEITFFTVPESQIELKVQSRLTPQVLECTKILIYKKNWQRMLLFTSHFFPYC
jgi:hypothetical protein